MELREEDKFTAENTEGFSQELLDQMNKELEEDIENIPAEAYESAVRHEKFRIIKKYIYKM